MTADAPPPEPGPCEGEVMLSTGPPPPPTDPVSVVSLVLGITSILVSSGGLCCMGLAGIPGVLLGGGGLGCGWWVLYRMREVGGTPTSRGLAIAGIVTGAVGCLIGLAFTGLMIVALLVSASQPGGGFNPRFPAGP